MYASIDVSVPENLKKYQNLKNNCAVEEIICEFKESEGITLVLNEKTAKQFDIEFEFRCRWITLKVHSSLEAVGLTAEFARVLTRESISCNVIAGFYHDHIFVGVDQAEKAVDVLKTLTK